MENLSSFRLLCNARCYFKFFIGTIFDEEQITLLEKFYSNLTIKSVEIFSNS